MTIILFIKNLIVLSFYHCKPEEFLVPTTYQGCQSGQGTGAGDFSLATYEHEPFLTFAEKKKEGGTKKN